MDEFHNNEIPTSENKRTSIVKLSRTINPFEILPRTTLQDSRLSLDALGALVRLSSIPGDWEWRLYHIETKILGIGRDHRKRIFRELEAAGYLTRSKLKGQGGKWKHFYNLILECTGLTSDGKAVDGEAVAGEGVDLHNTKSDNTDIQKPQLLPPENEAPVDNLVFSCLIDEQLRSGIYEILKNRNDAQTILDELAATLKTKGKDYIKNPLAWVRKVAKAGVDITPAGLGRAMLREEKIKAKSVT